MHYSALAECYRALDETTKRLEMSALLHQFFQTVPMDELATVVLLMQGKCAPDYRGIELGVSEKLALRAIADASGYDETAIATTYREKGDLGLAAADYIANKRQRTLFSQPLTVRRVGDTFHTIAAATGAGSQQQKVGLLTELLHDAAPLEATYLIRTVVGKLRLGVGDMTILAALAEGFETPTAKEQIERAYNLHPDLGAIAEVLCRDGLEALDLFTLTPGIPVRAMLAERVSSLEEIFARLGDHCSLEYKYDGLRIQAHITAEEVRLFSRRLEQLTAQFPDISAALRQRTIARSAVVEGECVPIDKATGELLPFQLISRRRGRKYGLASQRKNYALDAETTIRKQRGGGIEEDIPVALILFDCLYHNGEDLTEAPLPDRRMALRQCIDPSSTIQFATTYRPADMDDAEQFFTDAIAAGCEGVIAKDISPNSSYRAGARGYQWIKLKRDYKAAMVDTIDLVIVGAFAGYGRRAGVYGVYLMAAYDADADEFRTVCKLGTGLTDEMLQRFHKALEPTLRDTPPTRVVSTMEPDFWFYPTLVLETVGAEITLSPVHTCAYGTIGDEAGLAIRFPRFTGRVRDDKRPEDATTTAEIANMYRAQLKTVSK